MHYVAATSTLDVHCQVMRLRMTQSRMQLRRVVQQPQGCDCPEQGEDRRRIEDCWPPSPTH